MVGLRRAAFVSGVQSYLKRVAVVCLGRLQLPLVLRNHPEGVEDDGSTVLVATLNNDFEGFAAVRLGFGEPSLLLRNHGETLMRAGLR